MDMSKMVQVKGHEGYYFDEDYNIWSFKRKEPRQLKPFVRWKGKGSRHKHLRIDIAGKNIAVHRLVYETFIGEIPPGQLVRHLDDDETNNVPENLAVGTHKDNAGDCIRNGNFKSVLNDEKARELLVLSVHFKINELAEYFGVHRNTVSNIVNGVSWKHVSRENLKFQNQKEVI